MASDWFYGRSMDLALRRSYSTFRPPGHSSRRVISLIIAANALVYGAWYYGEHTADKALLRQLNDNFTLSLRNLKENRYYVLLTSAFSHMNFVHIAFNMLALSSFGQIISFMGVSGPQTLALCLTCGIAGSVAWAYHHAFIKPDPPRSGLFSRQVVRMKDLDTALGASGLVMGAGTAAACLAPLTPTGLPFLPVRMPLWFFMAVYAAVDTYFLDKGEIIGHAAHLGGAATGVVYYFLALRSYGGVWRLLSGRRM